MTPGEIISSSIAGVALIVAWLARFDSKKSAEAAQKSAGAAQQISELMSRQLNLAIDEQNGKIQMEKLESRPRFIWQGGSDSPMGGVSEREFQNLGGEVTDLAIQTTCETVSATIYPGNLLHHHGIGTVRFTGKAAKLTKPIPFRISCTTKLGERWEKGFKMLEGRDVKIVDA